MQNGISEAFNGQIRDELLNETIFYDLSHAPEVGRQVGSNATALRLSDLDRLRGNLYRKRRSASQPILAPTITHCSSAAPAPISAPDAMDEPRALRHIGYRSGGREKADEADGPLAPRTTKSIPL